MLTTACIHPLRGNASGSASNNSSTRRGYDVFVDCTLRTLYDEDDCSWSALTEEVVSVMR
jgi:hypothetical protein